MKKVILSLLSMVALLVLSGCSGIGEAESDRVVVVNHYETQTSDNATTTEIVEVADETTVSEGLPEVDILDLDDGYTVEGFSSYGNGA